MSESSGSATAPKSQSKKVDSASSAATNIENELDPIADEAAVAPKSSKSGAAKSSSASGVPTVSVSMGTTQVLGRSTAKSAGRRKVRAAAM